MLIRGGTTVGKLVSGCALISVGKGEKAGALSQLNAGSGWVEVSFQTKVK